MAQGVSTPFVARINKYAYNHFVDVDMLKAVLWTLALAAFAGLAWAAYQHSKGVGKNIYFVMWWLPTIMVSVYTILKCAEIGFDSRDILDYRHDPAKSGLFRHYAIEFAREFLYLLKVWSVYAAWVVFAFLVRNLPRIVGKDQETKG